MTTDWEARPLTSLLRRPPKYGINAPGVPLGCGTHTYLRITDIDDEGRFSPKPRVEVSHPDAAEFLLEPGNMVFARTGASVGKSYLYDPADGDLVYAGFLISVDPDPRLLNPRYLATYVQSQAYWDWVERNSIRSGQPGINSREYGQLPIPLPDMPTQDAIATVTGEADAQVRSLERVLAKMEAVKKGMLQQLVGGRTRLPGFEGEWRALRFCEIASPVGERIDPRRVDPETPLLELEHIDPGRGRLLAEGTAGDAVSLKSVFRPGDVLFGKLRAYLRKYWLADTDGLCSTECWVLCSTAAATGPYVRYLVETDRFIEVASGGYGTHMPRADWKVVRELKVKVPPVVEQEAIAASLHDADLELEALHARLVKAKAIKQGLIQELLGGSARIPVELVSA